MSDANRSLCSANLLTDPILIHPELSHLVAFRNKLFKMDFDNALKTIGEFGLYQKKFYMLLNMAVMPMSAQLLVLIFVAAPPTWVCLDLKSPSVEHCTANGTICSQAVYTSESTTIATEWNLVCGQSYKNELAQSVFMLGTMVGAPICGSAADKYGRKKLWMFVVTMSTFWGFLSSFAPTYYLFLVFRFLVGFCVGGGILVTFVLATEMIGPSRRGELIKIYYFFCNTTILYSVYKFTVIVNYTIIIKVSSRRF